MNQQSGWVESWILNLGRGASIFLGTMAAVAIAAGAVGVIVAGGYWLVGQPTQPPEPPALPAPAAITLDDAKRYAKPDFRFDQTSQEVARVKTSTLTTVATLKDLFPEPQYSWDEVYQETCRVRTSYGCMEQGRKVTRRGVARFVSAFLEQLPTDDDKDHEAEELRRLLKDVPVEERANLVAPILIANLKQRAEQQTLGEARSKEIRKGQLEYDDRLSTYRAQVFSIGTLSGLAIGYGLVVALGLCLLVAILAIERHLRSTSPAP